MQGIPSGTNLLHPERLIQRVGVGYGQVVAELGCGGGAFFVLAAGMAVGEKGKVYGVDIMKSALVGMMSQAKIHGLTNVVPVWSNLEIVGGAKKIKNNSVDVALAINLFHQTTKHEAVLREANRILKPSGKLLVVDWKVTGAPFGPSPAHRVSESAVRSAAALTGFREIKHFEAGPYHWGLAFEKVGAVR